MACALSDRLLDQLLFFIKIEVVHRESNIYKGTLSYRYVSIRGATEGEVTLIVGTFWFWIFEKLGLFEKGQNGLK